MAKGNIQKTAIDCFLWTQPNGEVHSTDTLIYYDAKGMQYKASLPKGSVEEALESFRGGLKTVRRSTGGFGLVEPFQVVLCEGTDEIKMPPEMRVRVRFRDFQRNHLGVVCGPGYETLTKTVLPQDLLPPFEVQYQASQTFVIDFGHGIVPIHIFHDERDRNDEQWVWFLEPYDLELVQKERKGHQVEVQPYRVSRDVLRFAIGAEYEQAKLRYSELRRRYGRIVPEALRGGRRRAAPSGILPGELDAFLRRKIKQRVAADELVPPARIPFQNV